MSSILEQQLVALADRIDVDVDDRFVDAILVRLDADQPGRPPLVSLRPPRPRRARTLVALLAAAALAMVFILPSPRRTVAHWFGIGSVRIDAPPITPLATTTPVTFPSTLGLGDPTNAADASSRTGLPTPLVTTLGAPTAIYVVTPPESGQVVVVYPPSEVLPASPVAGVGALLSTLPGSVDEALMGKVAGPGTRIDAFTFTAPNGTVTAAIWLSGEPHDYFFVGRDGVPVLDTMRLATNTLLWTVGDVTYRLEAEISRGAAVSIAQSVVPG